MANTTTKPAGKNIYQKLALARTDYINTVIKQSGVNPHAEFTYFELKDIVPVATEIFNKYNLLFVAVQSEDGERAVGTLIDTDNPESTITVSVKWRSISEPAKFRMNEVQAEGAEITYYRRYLYMLLLDIVERDEIDGGIVNKPKTEESKEPAPQGKVTVKNVPATPAIKEDKKPKTQEERKAIAKDLTKADGQADDMQLDVLKEALKILLDTDPEQEEFVQGLMLKTDGLKKITKEQCETLITAIGDMLANYEEEKTE